MTNKKMEELVRKDIAHFVHPFGLVGGIPEIIWDRGKGAKLWDINGKEYIDMSSGGFYCNNLGYCRQEVNDAICEQIAKLSHWCAGIPFTNAPAIEYAAELVKLLPKNINHVYFVEGGTRAVEVATQVAKFYWHILKEENRYKIIALAGGYHGASALTRSLSSSVGGLAGFGRKYPGIVYAPNYHCHRCLLKLKYTTCGIACADYLEKIIEVEEEDTIACMIGEPIQGPAGVIVPPDEYWTKVRKILDKHNILLISDEVMSGFGRTGKMFAIEHWGLVPDIIDMAKVITSSYIPFGAVGISDKIFDVMKGHHFMAGASSDGSPVGSAAAMATLKVLLENKIVERTAKFGEHIHARLVNEFMPLPCVDDVMGKGAFYSLEIALNKTTGSEFNLKATEQAREEIFKYCVDNGVIYTLFDGYPRRLMILPTCVITEDDELDRALDVLYEAMERLKPV